MKIKNIWIIIYYINIQIIYETNNQIGFKHPFLPDLNYISFCQFIEPITINKYGIKEGKNTVCIRPGKLDRSPCGTGTSARLALMRAKNEINIDEIFISKSIIDSKFESFVKDENIYKDYKMITPSIKGSAFITGKQEMYISDLDPFPYGYKLNDTWPDS